MGGDVSQQQSTNQFLSPFHQHQQQQQPNPMRLINRPSTAITFGSAGQQPQQGFGSTAAAAAPQLSAFSTAGASLFGSTAATQRQQQQQLPTSGAISTDQRVLLRGIRLALEYFSS